MCYLPEIYNERGLFWLVFKELMKNMTTKVAKPIKKDGHK